MSGWTTNVLICYFIAAQPPHGHDDPFTLVFAPNDFASCTFFLGFTPTSTFLFRRACQYQDWTALCSIESQA